MGEERASGEAKPAWHDEYYRLQDIITGYNSDCIQIKNWSVTVAAAAIAGAYVEDAPQLLLLAAAGAMGFLLTEAYWRANQFVFILRVRKIEENIQRDAARAPRISGGWVEEWGEENLANDWNHVFESAKRMRTWLPHLLIAAAALGLWKFAPPEAGPAKDACCGASVECCAARSTPSPR